MTSPSTTTTPTARDAFLALIKAADIFTAAQFTRAEAIIPRKAKTAEDIAHSLITAGLLTPFQAERLLAGRTDGFLLGPYIIQEQIGLGAMGRVYRGRHRTMKRTVAIKVLAAGLTQTVGERQTLQREVRAAARLNHPNIVAAYDANELAERFYLILEHVDGPNLQALLQERGTLPVGEACELIYQAALGLAHAHAHGLVHQNLKPSNLLLTRADHTQPSQLKIADFGISRLSPRSGEITDGLLGSADFIAPELVHNRHRADHRADLYSLGAILYYLLTGLPPFPGGTPEEKAQRHLFEEPTRVDRLRPDIHRAIADLVHQLLAKNPQIRPAAAIEVVARLDDIFGAISNGVSFDLPGGTMTHAAYHSGQPGGRIAQQAPAGQEKFHSAPFANLDQHGRNNSSEFDTSPWEEITGIHPATGPGSTGLTMAARQGSTSWRAAIIFASLLIAGMTATGFLLRMIGQ